MIAMQPEQSAEGPDPIVFGFRPWVRRAGFSILLTATLAGACLGATLLLMPDARFGWAGEPFVWLYVGVLAVGGARIYSGTFSPAASLSQAGVILRPLHQFRPRRIAWSEVAGTEQTVPGDRLILYYVTPRGSRFVAMNLNLIKGRASFESTLGVEMARRGFRESLREGVRVRRLGEGPG